MPQNVALGAARGPGRGPSGIAPYDRARDRRPEGRAPDPGDLTTEEAIEDLVRSFYRQAAVDDVLGPVFEAAEVDWAAHIPRVTAFWAWQLIGGRRYDGRPLRAHERVNELVPFREEHYERWLELFTATLHDGWSGPVAEPPSDGPVAWPGRCAGCSPATTIPSPPGPRRASTPWSPPTPIPTGPAGGRAEGSSCRWRWVRRLALAAGARDLVALRRRAALVARQAFTTPTPTRASTANTPRTCTGSKIWGHSELR